MRCSAAISQLLAATCLLLPAVSSSPSHRRDAAARSVQRRGADSLKPKVIIINMFSYEANVWYGIPDFDLLANNVTVPGFSPLFPDAHCTSDGEICQVVTGESGMSTSDCHQLHPVNG
jgi:purine nucleoside permease